MNCSLFQFPLVCLLLILSPFLEGTYPSERIFLHSLPKSGTNYLTETLSLYFGLCKSHYSTEKSFGVSLVGPQILEKLCGNPNLLIMTHIRPIPEHVQLLQKHYDRIWVHVRDPRQALVSLVYAYDKCARLLPRIPPRRNDNAAWFEEPTQEYFQLSFHEKIDWHIERYFLWAIAWCEDWIDIIEARPQLQIKITTFEHMIEDPLGFFQDVIAFYGSSPDRFQTLIPKENIANFRLGQKDEWRSVLTEQQQQRITSLMPQRLFTFYGWPKSSIAP